MKPFLIDIPVVLYTFVRPHTLADVFKVIKEARPSTLFIVSDGPRVEIPTDYKRIQACREITEDVDWDCKVYKLYSNENKGMYETFKRSIDFVFDKVDRCIFLEDDVVTSISFFQYCADLLEKYKDDLRINMICGMNHLGVYEEPKTDYFFSKGASIWGYALWRRSYESFYDFSYGDDEYLIERIKENGKEYIEFCRGLKGYYKQKQFGGHPAGPEFFLLFNMYAKNQFNIIPKKNMVCNIGYGDGATHAGIELKKMAKGVQQVFNMEIYEIEFPLEHPKYIIEDKNYEKKWFRIMGRNHPIISFYRRCEGIIRRIYFGDFNILLQKLHRKITKKNEVEK